MCVCVRACVCVYQLLPVPFWELQPCFRSVQKWYKVPNDGEKPSPRCITLLLLPWAGCCCPVLNDLYWSVLPCMQFPMPIAAAQCVLSDAAVALLGDPC